MLWTHLKLCRICNKTCCLGKRDFLCGMTQRTWTYLCPSNIATPTAHQFLRIIFFAHFRITTCLAAIIGFRTFETHIVCVPVHRIGGQIFLIERLQDPLVFQSIDIFNRQMKKCNQQIVFFFFFSQLNNVPDNRLSLDIRLQFIYRIQKIRQQIVCNIRFANGAHGKAK